MGDVSLGSRSQPMQIFDCIGKRTQSNAGNTAILFGIDAFSKFVWIVREATTKATINALKEKIFCEISVQEFSYWTMPSASH